MHSIMRLYELILARSKFKLAALLASTERLTGATSDDNRRVPDRGETNSRSHRQHRNPCYSGNRMTDDRVHRGERMK